MRHVVGMASTSSVVPHTCTPMLQISAAAKDLIQRLMCDVDERLGTNGVHEIKVCAAVGTGEAAIHARGAPSGFVPTGTAKQGMILYLLEAGHNRCVSLFQRVMP